MLGLTPAIAKLRHSSGYHLHNETEAPLQIQQIIKELEMAECGCGRSPNGNCVGWHDLTEEKYLEKKAAYEAKQAAK